MVIRRFNRNTRNHQFLGSGIHSKVYLSRSGYATKVCLFPDLWPEYVIWAEGEGYAGNLAPRVYSMRQVTGGYVATMELFANTLSVLDREVFDVAGCLEGYVYRRIHPAAYKEDKMAPKLAKYLPGYEGFVRGFEKRFGNYPLWDLGSRNLMIRPDGTICITDPISGEGSSMPHSWRSSRSPSIPNHENLIGVSAPAC